MLYNASIRKDSKNTVNNVKIDNLNKLNKAIIFEDLEHNRYIREILKDVIITCYHVYNGKETGALVNPEDWSYRISFSDSYEYVDLYHFINGKDKNTEALKHKRLRDFSHIWVHTHNEPNGFSHQDVVSFLGDSKLYMAILINSNLQVFVIRKKTTNKKELEKLSDTIAEIYNNTLGLNLEIINELNKNNIFIEGVIL